MNSWLKDVKKRLQGLSVCDAQHAFSRARSQCFSCGKVTHSLAKATLAFICNK